MTKITKDFDSICAISSPPGKGGVALIRVSGLNSILLVDKIFSKSIKESNGYQIFYGNIISKGEDIDDVILTVFKNPQSFTGEDTVEINCHGSIFIQQKILALLCENGAKIAQPGEFSKRAFLNRKLD